MTDGINEYKNVPFPVRNELIIVFYEMSGMSMHVMSTRMGLRGIPLRGLNNLGGLLGEGGPCGEIPK